MSLKSYIFPQVIYQTDSPYNGTIIVKEFFGERYIEVGGLSQSGSILTRLFQKAFKKLGISSKIPVKKILVLGVGGGSIISLLHDYFPNGKITAFDIDPAMLALAKTYFGIKSSDTLDIKVDDVFKDKTELGFEYDLIIVDVFIGFHVPVSLGSSHFLKRLKASLNKQGIVIFNHLCDKSTKFEAKQFLDKVKEMFDDVTETKVDLNLFVKAS